MSRRPALFLAAIVLAGLLGTAPGAGAAGFKALPVQTSTIDNFLIGRDEQRFGEFEFRGGVAISSPDREFGGLSGLDFDADGVGFTAISDLGFWFRGRAERAAGRLVGIGEPEWAPMLNAKGQPLGAKRNADAEGLRFGTLAGKPAAYVSFEQTNDLRVYRMQGDLALSRPEIVKLPKSAKGIRRNRGFEALAIAPSASALAGSPILITEKTLDKAGNHRAFIVRGPLAGAFSLVRSDDFDVTDADFLPNGDLLVLERRVIMPLGVQMRLRRIEGGAIRPGAVVDGPVVMQADMAHRIDNMEGLAVTRDADGATRITLVSDDNRSFIQRTLMLEFIWLGPMKSAASG